MAVGPRNPCLWHIRDKGSDYYCIAETIVEAYNCWECFMRERGVDMDVADPDSITLLPGVLMQQIQTTD